MLLVLLVAFAAAATFPTPVTITTPDGVALQAAYGGTAKAQNGVILVHMAGRSKEDWQLFGETLSHGNVQVLAVDLRGHGASGGKPPEGSPPDYAAMVSDVRAAVAWLHAKGCANVTLVGAELGANLVLNEAADDPSVRDLVLLSPGLDYKGVITTDAVRRYGARPLLIVASRDDTYAMRSATALDRLATGAHQVQLFDTAGKGTTMLNRAPALSSVLLGWIQSHWAALEAPPVASGPTIGVESRPLETSGPLAPDTKP
jgi:pimeloyl-ACP methyl ester carboxylesterase